MKLLLSTLFVTWVSIYSFGQTLVINEVAQGLAGNEEFVELLVIPDPSQTISCTEVRPCLDLRGWIFDDNNGYFSGGPQTGVGIAAGACRFADNPLWSCVPVGTLITIYNDADLAGPGDDVSLVDGDCDLVIPISSSLFERADNSINPLTPNSSSSSYPTEWIAGGVWSQISLANDDDSFQIYDPADLTTPAHAVSWGSGTGANDQNTIIYFGQGTTQDVMQANNSVDCDFSDQANWSILSNQASPSMGTFNTVENQNCIETYNNGCLDPMIASAISTNEDCNCDGTVSAEDPLLGTPLTVGSDGNYTYAWYDDSDPFVPLNETTATVTGLCPGTYNVIVTSGAGCIDTATVTVAPAVNSFDIISITQNGANCQITMEYCSETGGDTGSGADNTGAFGFVIFGGTVVNFESPVTSNSTNVNYSGINAYVPPATTGINLIYPDATGMIGYYDPLWSPIPPGTLPDWFLCNDDPSCGAQGLVCNTTMIEFPSASIPDSIVLVGIEGAFSTVNDLVNALGGNVGCEQTVYPTGCCVPPALILDPLAAVCQPSTVDLADAVNAGSGAGNLSYHSNLTDANAGTNPLGSSVVSSGGQYYIRLEDSGDPNCFTVDVVTVTIDTPPTATALSGVACSSDTDFTLGAGDATSSTGSFSWSENGAGSITNGGSTATPTYTIDPADAGNVVDLSLTVASGNSCPAATDIFQLTIDAAPTATALSGTACSSDADFTLGVGDATSSTGGYSWSENGAGSITSGGSTATPTYTIDPADAGNVVDLTLTVASGNSCPAATDIFQLTIDAAPTATALSGTACSSDADFTLGVGDATSSTGGYSWSENGAGSITSGGSTATPTYTIDPADAGNVVDLTLTVASGNSCPAASDVFQLTIDLASTASAASDAICANLTEYTIDPADVSSSTGTYSWTENGAGSITAGGNSNNPTYTLDPTDAGTTVDLTLTVVSGNSCPNASDIFQLTINSLPGVNDLTPSLCQDPLTPGTVAGIDLTSNNGNINATGPTYTWYTDPDCLLPVGASETNYTVSDADVFYVIVNDGTCQDTAMVTYSVTATITLNDPAPSLCEDAVGSGQVTGHDLTQYENSVFAGADTYTWTGGTTQTITNGQTINVQVTSGNCANNIDVSFTVISFDDPTFTTTPTCDGGTATITGTLGGTFTFTNPPADLAVIDGVTGSVTGGTPGATYDVTYTTGGTCPASLDLTVTALAQDDPTFTTTPTCDGGTATVTGTSGGTFTFTNLPADLAVIDGTTGSVTGGTPGATYDVTYTTGGTCPASLDLTVTALAQDDPTFTTTPTCDGGTATVTGTSGGTFTFTNPPADLAVIDGVTGSVTGGTPGATYGVTYTTGGTCPASLDLTVTALAQDDATFTMTPTCDGGTATITGTSGGTFTFTNSPADLAVIDGVTGSVTGGTPGATYDVTYTTGGACPASSDETVTASVQDDATFTMTPTCDGGTATITGTAGGTFTFTNAPTDAAVIDGATGSVTGGTPGATYDVTYTTGGTCPASLDLTVTALAQDDATFTMTPTCDGGTATITGTSGGTFTFTNAPTDAAIIDGATGSVTGGTPGTTYDVTYTTGGTCPASLDLTVTALAQDDATFTMTPTCDGGTATVTGTSGGTFTFTNAPADAAIIDASTGTITDGTLGGVYDVTYTTNGVCPSVSSQVFNALSSAPSLDAISDTSACGSLDLWTILGTGLTGSEAYYDNWPGLGGSQITGPISSTQTVYVYDGFGTCSDSLSFEVTIGALPTLTLNDPPSICEPETHDLTDPAFVSASSGIVSYFEDASFTTYVQDATAANDGVYYIELNDNGCIVTGVLNAVVLPSPVAPIAGDDSLYCDGQNLEDLYAMDSEGGVLTWYSDYTLLDVIGTGPNFTPYDEPGVIPYYITETGSNGCESEASVVSITIIECEITIPTAITPNGDQVNDAWEVVDLDVVYPNNNVKIYNRWGNLIFEHFSNNGSTPYEDNKWDGTYEGETLPVGSYYYVIQLNDRDNNVETGAVSIVLD